MRFHGVNSSARTPFMVDARVIWWDIFVCRYESCGVHDCGDLWPQELDGMQWMLGWAVEMVALKVLEQRPAGREGVNAVSCPKCPNRSQGIPSCQTARLPYMTTGQSQIKDPSSLNRCSLVSNTQRSRIIGTNVHT